MENEDEDFALALKLFTELNEGEGEQSQSVKGGKPDEKLSIVDPSWELIDPVPNIHELFVQFNAAYFDGMLASVSVQWSPRMTLCAGLCYYERRGKCCSIKLSAPLLKLRPRKDLVETLLHEMIHALLFVTDNNKDHDGHGPEFHKHMYRINKETGTNITVYHSFHDEVDHHRQHWWRCDGPCVKRPPFFGIVRRAMNRAPSPRDRWWNDHKQKCGGAFTKIKEPEKPVKQSKKSKKLEETGQKLGSSSSESNKNNKNAITNWFQKTDPSKPSTSSNISDPTSIDCEEDLKPPVNPWADDGYSSNSKNSKPTNKTNSNPKTKNNNSNHGNQNKGKYPAGSTAVKGGGSRTSTITSKGKNPPTNENDIYRSSSTGASSNIYGFKMSANNKEDSAKQPLASFSGNGKRIGSTNDEPLGNSGRENFLKRLENNMKGNTQRKPSTNSSQISIPPSSNTFRKPKDSDFSMKTQNKDRTQKKETTGKTPPNQPSFSRNPTTNQNEPPFTNKQPHNAQSNLTNTKRNLSSTSSQNSLSNSPKKTKLSKETHMVISSDEEDNVQQQQNFVDCPACPMRVPEHLLNEHLDECLTS